MPLVAVVAAAEEVVADPAVVLAVGLAAVGGRAEAEERVPAVEEERVPAEAEVRVPHHR